jgi:enoyl-CoA hydratase
MELLLSFVQLRVDETHIAHLLLHRPEKHNALSRELIEDIHRALDELQAHEDTVRALIISGAGGKAFAAGADIAELAERTRNDAFLGINSRLFQRIEQLPMPTLAAIEGFCLGGGCELALACDLRIASKKSRFGQPEAGLGIVAGAGATFRLARLVGLGKARELLFTGRIITAEEAERIGLIEKLVEDGLAQEEAFSLARVIAQKAPLAIRLTKTLLNSYGRNLAGENQLLAELSQAILFESEDKLEGMRSFLEKRSPTWKGK